METLDGDVLAWLYVLNAYEGGLPSARYLGIMADAAEKAGAPADYVADLRGRPSVSPAAEIQAPHPQASTAMIRASTGSTIAPIGAQAQFTRTPPVPGRPPAGTGAGTGAARSRSRATRSASCRATDSAADRSMASCASGGSLA